MAADPGKSKSTKLLNRLLRKMLLIRRFEEKSAQMYGLRKIGGFCHLYIGQEASAVGSIAALDMKKDYVLTAYRDHGHAIACGMAPIPALGRCDRGYPRGRRRASSGTSWRQYAANGHHRGDVAFFPRFRHRRAGVLRLLPRRGHDPLLRGLVRPARPADHWRLGFPWRFRRARAGRPGRGYRRPAAGGAGGAVQRSLLPGRLGLVLNALSGSD